MKPTKSVHIQSEQQVFAFGWSGCMKGSSGNKMVGPEGEKFFRGRGNAISGSGTLKSCYANN